ncbi:MAG: hypothetical protein COT06_00645 [Syntrophobacteraceae bacterium CG07_land_8_20_14_0_80_61_8]|nr:MAG: hypothetical protein COT06_00645 [Syntrophobacteraceae bacterium CG07_land_8_20_14_0_80_61_8]
MKADFVSTPAADSQHGSTPALIEKEIIGSGERRLSGKCRRVLEAFLGSCVGVTLCDPERELGGMIHFLLPEPISPTMSLYASRYASTGLPKFLDELVRAGARKEHLRACVAGGALVGEVSAFDLNLDIGGRTSAVVERILSEQQIPIARMETGGFFTCKMSLDLSNFKTSIEPVMDQDFARAERTEPRPFELDRDFPDLMRHLKPIPQVALKILRMIDDQNCRFADIADQVKQDQTISAKVLHICNSTFFGRGRKVDSIERALTVLGERNLIKFIVSAFLERFLFSTAGGYSICKGGLYYHALATAQLGERLARLTGVSRPDLAYTGGLLHDIGKVALDQFVAASRPLFYRQVISRRRSAVEVEQELIGIDHTVLGAMIGDSWGFPDSLREVVLHHHAPERARHQQPLVRLIHLADLIMARFAPGYELERIDSTDLDRRLQALGLAPDRLREVVDQVPSGTTDLV